MCNVEKIENFNVCLTKQRMHTELFVCRLTTHAHYAYVLRAVYYEHERHHKCSNKTGNLYRINRVDTEMFGVK